MILIIIISIIFGYLNLFIYSQNQDYYEFLEKHVIITVSPDTKFVKNKVYLFSGNAKCVNSNYIHMHSKRLYGFLSYITSNTQFAYEKASIIKKIMFQKESTDNSKFIKNTEFHKKKEKNKNHLFKSNKRYKDIYYEYDDYICEKPIIGSNTLTSYENWKIVLKDLDNTYNYLSTRSIKYLDKSKEYRLLFDQSIIIGYPYTFIGKYKGSLKSSEIYAGSYEKKNTIIKEKNLKNVYKRKKNLQTKEKTSETKAVEIKEGKNEENTKTNEQTKKESDKAKIEIDDDNKKFENINDEINDQLINIFDPIITNLGNKTYFSVKGKINYTDLISSYEKSSFKYIYYFIWNLITIIGCLVIIYLSYYYKYQKKKYYVKSDTSSDKVK